MRGAWHDLSRTSAEAAETPTEPQTQAQTPGDNPAPARRMVDPVNIIKKIQLRIINGFIDSLSPGPVADALRARAQVYVEDNWRHGRDVLNDLDARQEW